MLRADELASVVKKLEGEVKDKEKSQELKDFMRMYTGDDEIISSEEYAAAMARLRGDDTILKLKSGLSYLDTLTEGFWEGNVIIVSGPTKEGKTTLCQTLTINFTKSGYPCLWFPFDTPGDEVISRFQEPIKFYLPKRNPSQKKIDWIEQKIIEGIAKHRTRVVFIDHLAMLTRASENERNYSTELQSIMMELKQIAIRWRVVMFINHHIRKIQTDTNPMLSDLKDSSGVAQDSDMVIMIWRKKEKKNGVVENSNKSVVQIQANRRTGRTGKFSLEHKGDHFEEEKPSEIPLRMELREI